jgi:DNA-binding transcriptional ArsR family regulator
MEGRTYQLLRGLGNEARLAVLGEVVASGSLTHRELLTRTRLGKVALSKALSELTDLGLVLRPSSNREPWTVRFPAETRAMLIAAAYLAALTSEAQARADRELADRLRRGHGG